jgi:CHASE3 domain sensor protein
MGMSVDEHNLLRHKVKTLSCQLKTANETIRQLDDRNARMSDLAVQLVKTEEQLEYTTEENKEYSSNVWALEQALILQETELDNALAVIRLNDQAKRERDLLEAIKQPIRLRVRKATNHFISVKS